MSHDVFGTKILDLFEDTYTCRNEQLEQSHDLSSAEQVVDEQLGVDDDDYDNESKKIGENVENPTLDLEPTPEAASGQVEETVEDENTTFQLKYKCPRCSLKFTSLKSLNLHSIGHKRFICPVCPFYSQYKAGLDDHLKTHSGEALPIAQGHLSLKKSGKRKGGQTIFCPKCDYSTRWSWHMHEHLILHNKSENLYKCDQCSYTTYLERYLKKHKITHNREQMKCNEPGCSYSTHYKNELERHLRISHTEVLLQCEGCDFSSNDIDEFTAHKRLHNESSSLNFQCKHCSRTFDRSTGFKQHLKSHFPQNIPCELCGVKCKSPGGLAIHMKKIHHSSTKEC